MQRILTRTGIPGERKALAFGGADILKSPGVRLQADVPVALPAPEEVH
jgi:hypothetical protein